MTQQVQHPNIIDMKIHSPKNSKLFTDTNVHRSYMVHYNHVILTIQHIPPCENKIVSCYVASPTSQTAIQSALSFFGIEKSMRQIYEELGKTDSERKSDRQGYARSGEQWNGSFSPRYLKADWQRRISALEKYDYKLGHYLFQDSPQ